MIRLVALLVLVPLALSQVRKPTRGIGRLFLWGMNRSHSRLTDWGLTHVTIARTATILDAGCGGGRTVQKLAAFASDGKVYGIDYSPESVAVSRMTNTQLIRAGRVDIREASVSQLPFAGSALDLVTAVETHYYWPDLGRALREVRRVLKPGGTPVIIAESYKGGRYGQVQQLVMKPLRAVHLTAQEHHDVLLTAGFSEVRIFEEPRRGWICAVATTPH